jgi:hypothetical protein
MLWKWLLRSSPSLAKVRARLQEKAAPERWPSGLRRTLGKRVCGKPYRGFESHSLRHYTVLLCIRLFEITGKTTTSATKTVAASSAMLPPVTAQTVGFDRRFGGRISRGGHMAGKLKPLDVERETRPGKYPDGDGLYLVVASATSKNWNYRYWKEGSVGSA